MSDLIQFLSRIVILLVILLILSIFVIYQLTECLQEDLQSIINNQTLCEKYISLAQANIPNGANLTSALGLAQKQCGSNYSVDPIGGIVQRRIIMTNKPNEPSIDFFIIILFIPLAIMCFILFYLFGYLFNNLGYYQQTIYSPCYKYDYSELLSNVSEQIAWSTSPQECENTYNNFNDTWNIVKEETGSRIT